MEDKTRASARVTGDEQMLVELCSLFLSLSLCLLCSSPLLHEDTRWGMRCKIGLSRCAAPFIGCKLPCGTMIADGLHDAKEESGAQGAATLNVAYRRQAIEI